MHSPHLFLHLYPAFLFSSMSPLRRHGHFAVIAPVCFMSRILAQAVFSTQNVFFLLFYLVTTHSSDFIRASLLQRCLLQFPDETKCPYYRIIWNYISILYSICLFFFFLQNYWRRISLLDWKLHEGEQCLFCLLASLWHLTQCPKPNRYSRSQQCARCYR